LTSPSKSWGNNIWKGLPKMSTDAAYFHAAHLVSALVR
jgi:hypothetical protein